MRILKIYYEKRKIILFDLDDTLFDSTSARRNLWNNQVNIILKYLNEKITVEEVLKLMRQSYDEANKDEDKMQIIFVAKLKNFIINNKEKEIFENLENIKAYNYSKIVPFKKVIETFEWLINNGFELGIASAGTRKHQILKIKSLEIEKYLKKELIFISEDLNYSLKKDISFFEKIKKMIQNSDKNIEIHMVGDKPTQDIISPILAGFNECFLLMNSYHYEKKKKN